MPDDNEFPYQREYPTGELFANVTGYYSLALGATQLERTQNAVLTGQTAQQRIGNIEDVFTGGEGTGDVHMTLRADLQETARQALAGRNGSVVMLDVQTGAVLAMYSNPTYDPNLIVDPDFDAARAALEQLLEAPGNPLLANAYQDRFMPGSTFKVLTTGIALDAGTITLDTQFERLVEWVPPQTSNPIQNYDGTNCGGDLREVFRRSCNIPFAQTAAQRRHSRDDQRRAGVGRRRADPVRRQPAHPAGGEHVRQHRATSISSCRCWRCVGSASRRTRWSRCTWRWSPPPSPTTG